MPESKSNRPLAAALLIALLVPGCGGSADRESGASSESAAESSGQVTPANTAAAGDERRAPAPETSTTEE